MLTLTLLVIVFLTLSGVMAAVDAAVLSVTEPEIDEMVLTGQSGACSLKRVRKQLTRAVVVIVIVTNSINILGPIWVGQYTVQVIGSHVLGWVVLAMTVGSIVVSEIVPKAIGTHYAPIISRLSAGPIRSMQLMLFPVVIVLERLSDVFTTGKRRIGTEQQIRSLTKMGEKEGYIEADEGQLIHRAFVLNDRTATDIMTPFINVVAFSENMSIAEATDRSRRSPFSLFPVTSDSPNVVSGLVTNRDLLEASVDGKNDEKVRGLIRPVFFVGPDTTSDELLLAFRMSHLQLAVVQDRRKTVGIVTMEDVLEELVGQIRDRSSGED